MSNSYTFHNWADTIQCSPTHFAQPKTEAEVIEIVKSAEAHGQVVRVFGAGHSWSGLALTDDVLLNLDDMDRILHVDQVRKRVTVQAGIRIKNLVVELVKHGLAMLNLGSIMEQSIAGATSTGTHGTGITIGSLHTQIVGMRIVSGGGRVVEITEADGDLLRAARVSLGALGVIVEITLQCVEAFNVELVAHHQKYDTVLANLDDLVRDNERFRFYWFAGNDDVYVNTMNTTSEPPTKQNPIIPWFRNVFLRHDVFAVLLAAEHMFPSLVDYINQFETKVGFQKLDEVGIYYDEIPVGVAPRHIECEYAVPYENAVEAIRVNRKIIEEGDFKVAIPLEVRFVKADDAMLSPAYKHDVCYLCAETVGKDFAMPYFAALEPAMKALGGRPHWGKIFNLIPSEVAEMYPEAGAFNKIRRDLDPKGTFANELIKGLFEGV